MSDRGTLSFERVLDGLAANSPAAAEAVVRHHYARIIDLVRKRLGRRYQAKVDAEDIANSVMKSFFRRYTGDRLAAADWDDLWALLATIALNKLSHRVRWYQRACRDAAREQDAAGVDLAALTDGPEAEVIVNDLYAHLTGECTAEEREVLDLSLQGHSIQEIADAVGVCLRTVHRVREAFRRSLEALRDADG